MPKLFEFLPCVDSEESAKSLKHALDVPRYDAVDLGCSAHSAVRDGFCHNPEGEKVLVADQVSVACGAKLSIAPEDALSDVEECQSLLRQRIHRVLAIAQAYGYETPVLGAWGCGAFRNDPSLTATDFRKALENDFAGAFSEIVFAITDWSPERRFL